MSDKHSTGAADSVVTATTTRRRRVSWGRDFHFLWTASLVSTLGDGVLLAAMPLMAKSLTTDPRYVSAVAFSGRLPWLLLALAAGVLVDRLNRRKLMVGAQAGQVLLITTIALVVTFDLSKIWMLYILAFCVGIGDILFTSSSQALIPTIVRRDDLESANGRIAANEWVSREFAGPPLGALLFALALPLPFWLSATTLLISLTLISRIHSNVQPVRPDGRRAMLAEIREGLRWLARSRLPRVLTIISAAGNFCEAMALSILVLFAQEVLHVGDTGFGVLLAAMAFGGVIGGLVSGRVVGRVGARQVAIGVQVVCPLAWLAIGLIGRDPYTVVALFTLFSIALSMWIVVAAAVRQRLIPNELLGRVTSASRMFAYGATPLGALAGGFVASSFGLIAPWILGGALSLLVAACALPALWRWDR